MYRRQTSKIELWQCLFRRDNNVKMLYKYTLLSISQLFRRLSFVRFWRGGVNDASHVLNTAYPPLMSSRKLEATFIRTMVLSLVSDFRARIKQPITQVVSFSYIKTLSAKIVSFIYEFLCHRNTMDIL